ncbi:acyl-CoA thioesterase [Streptomyces sp. NPDC021100]|uniref:acyl-CoA thioesterase n=1 Tax=Streptomyces sp. NPDC021100 TaxID=3365114 RepID=UPI003790E296
MARHIYACPLRWSDMDAFGHVNNAVFLRYLEEARIDFLFSSEFGKGNHSFSDGSVVARHEIDYLRPLVHRPEPVVIESWVTHVSRASLTISYEIKDEERVYARASTVVVPIDRETGRPRRISEEERELLAGYRDETAAESDADTVEGAVAV